MSDAPLPLDTGVLIALAAATGSWSVLEILKRPIIVTPAVYEEIRGGPNGSAGSETPLAANMAVWERPFETSPLLLEGLDKGEASVIGLAMTQKWPEVGIDESMGRAVARTSGLRLTGSLGLLIRAKRKGHAIAISDAIVKIRAAGIWIGDDVERAALRIAGEE